MHCHSPGSFQSEDKGNRFKLVLNNTVKPLIKDTPKEDKPPNKGQAESTLVYTLYRKSPLKEDSLSAKDKTAGPKGVLIKRYHCSWCTSIIGSKKVW